MANTNILIKRSSSTGKPVSLAAGELAYSYLSNTIFIGTPGGNGVVNVGGQYYTSQIDNATSANVGNSLVRRDPNGNATFYYVDATYFVGTFEGNAVTATALQNGRNFKISGGDISAANVSFNGTGDVVLNASLDAVPGLSAGSYGSSTSIPVVTVGANGRVLAISTSSIDTTFGVAADSGTTDTFNTGETLTFTGGQGISTAVDAGNNRVTFDVDNTVVRSNTAITNQTIDGSVTIAGNLVVQGTQTTINTVTLNVADPLIILASNNTTDGVDIGFAGHYSDGATSKHTGFFRDAGTKEYYVFDEYTPELFGNNNIDVAHASFNKANINAGWIKSTGIINNGINLDTHIQGLYNFANTTYSTYAYPAYQNIAYTAGVNTTQNTNITAADAKAQGAYDRANGSVVATSSLTHGRMVVGDGGNNVTTVANTSYTLTGSLSDSKTITSLTVDAYGRVTAATAASINIDATQIASGSLVVARGGTGQSSFTTGAILVGNGINGIQELANSTYTATGSGAANNTVSSLTVDSYGRLTAATFSAISGLTVGQGGTGRSSFTTNGIVYGNSTDGLLATAVAGAADQTWSNQILTVTNAGVPVWTNALDGGTF
jgi:hypothetical protein